MPDKKLVISSKKFRGDSSVVSVRLPNDMIEKLDAIAEQTGRTRNEIIQKNPARMIDLPATEKVDQQIPTPEEAKRLLEILANEPEEYKLFYALAIYTGCRRGELCALRWSDFTCVGYDGILTVQNSRSSVLGQGIAEGTTKNGKARTIYLYDDMMSLLRGYGHYKQEEAKQNKRRFSEYLFVNANGTPIHPDTFTKHLRRIYDENGFSRHFHLHTLRHYFVSTMLHSGVDKQTVADLAGHGDTSFLERTYCHPQMALKEQAAKKMFSSMLEEVIAG